MTFSIHPNYLFCLTLLLLTSIDYFIIQKTSNSISQLVYIQEKE